MAIVVAATGVATACTPLPKSFSVSPDTATARATTKIAGEGVLPGTPVEILWNGRKDEVLAKVQADDRGRFTLPITVPPLSPGAYSIVFVAPTPHGRTDVVGRVPFRLTSPAGTTAGAGTTPGPEFPAEQWQPVHTYPAASASSAMLWGMALAGGGSVMLIGTSVVAITRRRLATAQVHSD